MKILPLSPDEINAALATLPGWRLERDALAKTYTLENFRAAMGFMLRAGFEADALDHHPEWTNVYNRVSIRLCTHDSGDRVTALDVKLAQKIEHVAHS
jgi:4a-hydroxytetrahydrobiopterin dehydratase